MPLVTISMIAGRPPGRKRAVSDAVHRALVDCFRIPASDYNHRLVEYAPGDYLRPPGKTDDFVLVEMTVFPGRSREAKKRLYRAIVDGLGSLGIPPADVLIVLQEPPLVNWGVRGGFPADEVDLGFEIKV